MVPTLIQVSGNSELRKRGDMRSVLPKLGLIFFGSKMYLHGLSMLINNPIHEYDCNAFEKKVKNNI